MQQKVYTLEEVAEIVGEKVETIRTRRKRNKIPYLTYLRGSKTCYGLTKEMLELLKAEKTAKEKSNDSNNIVNLIEEWESDQRFGIGYKKPLSVKTIRNHKWAIDRFYHLLGVEKDLLYLNANRLKEVYRHEDLAVDDVNRNCHYSYKQKIYDAATSFYKFLISKGLKDELELTSFRKLRPNRKHKARRTRLEIDEFNDLITFNSIHTKGRTEYDRKLMDVMLKLYTLSGLRLSEGLKLQVRDIDLIHGVIHVIEAKGFKDRKVGIPLQLKERLELYINKERPKSDCSRLLLTEDGRPVTKSNAEQRMRRLARSAGRDITTHGLRRTFATWLSDSGASPDIIKNALGHSSYVTSEQSYIHTSERKTIAFMRNLSLSGPQESEGNPGVPQDIELDPMLI